MRKQRNFMFLVIGVCVALTVNLGMAARVAAKTYTNGLAVYFGVIPFYIADAKGFYEEEGVSMRQRFYSTTEWYQAVMSRKNDMMIAWSDSVLDFILNDQPYVILGAIHQDAGGVKMVVKQGTDPAQLPRIGIPNEAAIWKWVVWTYLRQHGQSLEGKRLIALNAEELSVNFVNGRLPAVATIWSPAAEAMVADGKGEIVFSNADHPDPFLLLVTMQKERYQSMPKDELKAFWRATIEALDWVNDPANQAESLELLAQGPARDIVSGIDNESAFAGQLSNHKFFQREELQRVNAGLQNTIQGLLDFRRDVLGETERTIALDEWVDTSALLDVLAEMP